MPEAWIQLQSNSEGVVISTDIPLPLQTLILPLVLSLLTPQEQKFGGLSRVKWENPIPLSPQKAGHTTSYLPAVGLNCFCQKSISGRGQRDYMRPCLDVHRLL